MDVVGDTNSESNVLLSDETDDSMSEINDAEEAISFPTESFLQVMEGVNKLPAWTVFPKQLAECIRATSAILRSKQGYTPQEATMMRRLVREGLGQTFPKCLEDTAVLSWPSSTQQEIFGACLALVELATVKLEAIISAEDEEEIAELEDDLGYILGELVLAFDPNTTFHVKNMAEERPSKHPELSEDFAAPSAESDSMAPVWNSQGSPEAVELRQHEWLAYLVNEFGRLDGFDLICRILDHPKRHSIMFLDCLLAPLIKADELLLPNALTLLAAKLQGLLKFLGETLKENLEHLSDKGRDRMFISASSLLERINQILLKCYGGPEADSEVGKVQRQFIVKLLGQSSFSKHLSAVREINNLLMRALGLRSIDNGNSTKVNVEWMQENDVVKHLLRANLHQKQYVDQVQKVLKNLTIEGGLQEDHLDLLWNLTEKVDTFETVKNNVYDMLGDLAQDFNNQQLDALFSKFESCTGRPDAMKIMDLMRRLAKSDTKGVMAKRVMSLLWSLMMNPDASSEVSKSPAITDALQAYANRKGLVDREITYEYMQQCITQIQAGSSVLAAMNLLQRLANASGRESNWQEGNDALVLLEKDFGIMDVVITSLEEYMERERQAKKAAGRPALVLEANPEHAETINEYATFLLNVPICGPIEISWSQTERIWTTLVDGQVHAGDRYLAFHLMHCQANQRLLSNATLNHLLTEKLMSVSVDGLVDHEPQYFWLLFSTVFQIVAVAENKLALPVPAPEDRNIHLPVVKSLELTGLPALWRIVLESDDSSVLLANAQQQLVSLYTNLDAHLQKEMRVVRMQFIEMCLQELFRAAELLTGCSPGHSSWRDLNSPPAAALSGEQQLASRKAARCMSLLQDMVAICQGRTMPAVPMHVASFQGPIARFEVQTSTTKQQPNRFRITCHSHMYVGQMRRIVAAKLTVQPEYLRLFAQGKELLSDARLVKEENIADGTTLMAAASPQANSYTLLSPERAAEMEEASPASLLAKSPQVYDLLLCIAGICREQSVRLNALKLLDVMPTDSQIVRELHAVLGSPNPRQGMSQLLAGAGSTTKPARLLYTLQALNAMLFPVTTAEEPAAAAAPQDAFVSSGCICALLEAVKAADKSTASDVNTVRSLHSSAQLLMTKLQSTIAKSNNPDVPMADASEQSGSTQEAGGVQDASAPSAEPATPTAAVTVTIEGSLMDISPEKSGGVSRAVLADMMLFYLNLAIKAGRGWREWPSQQLRAETPLLDQDAVINQDAMAALKSLLEMQPQLLDILFTSTEHAQALTSMILEGLLNGGHEVVRLNTFRFGERVCKFGNGQGHLRLLEVLHDLSAADLWPSHCSDYYRLLTEIVRSYPQNSAEVKAVELPIIEGLLAELILVSETMTADDEEDGRLEGKLTLLLELITVLDRRHTGMPDSGNLVRRIIADYLFPESLFLHKVQDTRQSLLKMTLPEILGAQKARCISKTSRTAAMELLHDLMTHHSANLRDGMELIRQIHLSTDIINEEKIDYTLRAQPRKPNGFTGLRNAGATCYMNSVFQQLFMQPSIRRLILSAREVPKLQRPDSVFYQLQTIFANLALCGRDSYRPMYFWKAFKDYDGEPLNVREHQDAYEFFTRLQDLVDQHMRDEKEKPAMQLVMGGKFAQQIICRNVPFRSEKEEDFYQVSLDVRGKRTLEESLDFYVQGELMEGDNQYLCEELNQKVDAVKRNCIKALPHMLVIHLKRFEYDYETMNRWKIKDRFEFPQELDMYKYTVTGLEEREASENAMTSESAEPPASSPANSEQFKYHLKGIVVHSGTAFAGHYYSYIKVRSEAGQQLANAGQWFCFDDNSVEPWDVANLDRDCFGGKYTVDLADAHLPGGPKEYDRPNSAYMLFYERSDALEPVKMMEEIVAAAPREAASQATGIPAAKISPAVAKAHQNQVPELDLQERGPGMISSAGEASSSGRELTTVPIPNLANSIPSIYEDVLIGNLKFVQEFRLLDRDYFKFLFKVVKDASEEPFLPPSSMRRTEPSPTASGGNSTGSLQSSPETAVSAQSGRRGADTDQAAERVMNFAGQFLLRVYLRTSALLREDQEAWRQVMRNVMEANSAANRWFLSLCFLDSRKLSALTAPEVTVLDETLLDNYLIWCNLEDVSKFVAELVLQALKNAIEKDNGALPKRVFAQRTMPEARTGAWAVYQTLATLHRTIKRAEFMKQNYYPMQFINLVQEYAMLGPLQREQLNGLNFLRHSLIACESADDRKTTELINLMGLISLLARSSDFNQHLEERPDTRNPYALSTDLNLHKGSKEVFSALWTGIPGEFLFMPQYLTFHEPSQLLLEFLQWQNQPLTLLWLKQLPKFIRKLQADSLNTHAMTLGRLIAVNDRWKSERVRVALYEPQPPNKDPGLLHMACEAHPTPPMSQAKRFSIIRLIVVLLQQTPQVFQTLQSLQNWVTISDWLERMQAQRTAVSGHPDFLIVDKLLQAIITGSYPLSPPQQTEEDGEGDDSDEQADAASQPQDTVD